jgi:hypothetical protein
MSRFTPENYETNNLNGLEDIMYLSSKLGAKLTPVVEQLLTVMPECLAISLIAFSLKASVHAMVARVPDMKRKRQFNKIIEEVKKRRTIRIQYKRSGFRRKLCKMAESDFGK